MIKKTFALILAGSLLLLSACTPSADSQSAEIDLDALADKLLESELFDETLNPVDGAMAEKIYAVSDSSSVHLYVGSGAVADELALFEFEDETAAQEAVELANARVESQKESFAAYIPEEVTKLDSAVVKNFGRYLVVCVSGGDEAEKIISDFFEQEG